MKKNKKEEKRIISETRRLNKAVKKYPTYVDPFTVEITPVYDKPYIMWGMTTCADNIYSMKEGLEDRIKEYEDALNVVNKVITKEISDKTDCCCEDECSCGC